MTLTLSSNLNMRKIQLFVVRYSAKQETWVRYRSADVQSNLEPMSDLLKKKWCWTSDYEWDRRFPHRIKLTVASSYCNSSMVRPGRTFFRADFPERRYYVLVGISNSFQFLNETKLAVAADTFLSFLLIKIDILYLKVLFFKNI